MHATFANQEDFIISRLRDIWEVMSKLPVDYRDQMEVLMWLDKCIQRIASQFMVIGEEKFSKLRDRIQMEIERRRKAIEQ